MVRLRFPWLWMTLGWALVAAVCVGSLVPGQMLAAVTFSDKLQHAGSYFVLMVWFAGMYEKRRQVRIAIVLAVLGFGLDALQLTTATRVFDLADVAANVAGIALGLGLSLSALAGWCQRVERYLPA